MRSVNDLKQKYRVLLLLLISDYQSLCRGSSDIKVLRDSILIGAFTVSFALV